MTSKVTIDAHSGLDILVTFQLGEPGNTPRIKHEIVKANTKVDFYIHSGMKILEVSELENSSAGYTYAAANLG